MRKLISLAAAMILAVPMLAHAQEGKAAPAAKTTPAGKAAPATPSFTAHLKETKKFTITQIDKASRSVTLKPETGEPMTVHCGDEVRNFAQLKVGDVVQTTYSESLTLHVEGSGEASATAESMTSRAKPGEKPSASVTDRTTVKASIQAIDKVKGTVTLHTASGETFTVAADNKANLDKLQVGNAVVATYTVVQAVAVNKPQAKKVASN